MTPVHRELASDLLAFDLSEEIRIVREELRGAHERIARTLVKEGPLRLTLVGVNPGGALRPHEAAGPIAVQVLEGEIEFEAAGVSRTLAPGSIVVLDGGVRHAVRSTRGGIFLLTLTAPGVPREAVRPG
ncbi:MAG TPA: cupin domain-containing protein [Gemmatimonadaceae bacterium]